MEWNLNKDGTGNLSVAGKKKSLTWRCRGNNLIFNMDGKDSGFLIEEIDEQKMLANDPQGLDGKPMKLAFTRKKQPSQRHGIVNRIAVVL